MIYTLVHIKMEMEIERKSAVVCVLLQRIKKHVRFAPSTRAVLSLQSRRDGQMCLHNAHFAQTISNYWCIILEKILTGHWIISGFLW